MSRAPLLALLALSGTAAVLAVLLPVGRARARRVLYRAGAVLRSWWQVQVALQERHLQRHDVSGSQARAAVHTLRWRDGRLLGELLPDRPEQAA